MSWIFLIFTTLTAFAYIPEYSLIANHAADQHGKGAFMIEQEVTYRKENEAYSVLETWYVLNENTMRVTLEGRGSLKGLVRGSVIYDGGQKFFVQDGQTRGQRLGEEWLEPLFHFRSPRYLRSRLVNLRIAPAESLKDRTPLNAEGDPGYTQPDFIRLARVGGSTAWAIGNKPTGAEAMAAWIEQDQFVLRKLRGSRSVMNADDYVKYGDGLWYPRHRSYAFGKYTVEVQTVAVKPLGKLKEDNRFRSSGLNPARDVLKLPDAEPLREFFSRFR